MQRYCTSFCSCFRQALANGSRQFHSHSHMANAAAVASAPAVVKGEKGGLLSILFGARSPQLPPMDDPLPGVRIPPPLADFPASTTSISTLPNGLKIATEDLPVRIFRSVPCGSFWYSYLIHQQPGIRDRSLNSVQITIHLKP